MTKISSMAGLLIGLGLLGVAAIVGIDAMTMRVPPVYAKVGPQVFPTLVAAGLLVTGIMTVYSVLRRDFSDAEGETDWRAIIIVIAGLILHLNLLKMLGFIPAGVVLFLAVSIGFGSRRYVRDAIIALGIVTLVYFCFTRFLGLQLPAGVLKGLL
jgi:putative tricarboxylic transport membrane protein